MNKLLLILSLLALVSCSDDEPIFIPACIDQEIPIFGKGIYYFNIKKGYNNNITIKRVDKKKAVDAYRNYLKTQPENCDWLGKWDGKKFIEDNFEKIAETV